MNLQNILREKFKGGNTSQSKCEGGEREFVSFGSELGTLNNSQVNSILWASLCSCHSATALSPPPTGLPLLNPHKLSSSRKLHSTTLLAQLLLVLVASQWNQSYINCTNNSAHSLCNGQASSSPLPPFTQPPLPLAAPLAQLSCSQAEDKGAWNDNQSQKNHHFAADRNASQNRQR